MSQKKFVLKKMMSDFIIINLIINGIFYVLNFRTFSGQLRFSDITNDLLFGLLLLGVACSTIGFINIKKELNKEKIDVSNFQTTHLNQIFPQNLFLRVLLLATMTMILSLTFFVLLPKAIGLDKINHLIGFSFKTLTAGVMATIIGYIVIDLSISDHQAVTLAKLQPSK